MPFYESTITVRFKIEVNEDIKFNNMLEDDEVVMHNINSREKYKLDKKRNELKKLSKDISVEDKEVSDKRDDLVAEIKEMEESQKEIKYKHDPLYFTLHEYTLPSLISKVIKTMYRDEIGKIDTNRVDKLTNNFSSGFIKKEWFKDDIENKISIWIHLVDFDHPEAFYKLPIEDKLKRIQAFKKVATDFFKANEFKKACKMYQKINGYYNFGDANNNFLKEDENSLHFKKCYDDLWGLKEP